MTEIPAPAEARKILVEELRSGRYLQARKALHRAGKHGQDSYCCLGVACKVAVERGWLDLDIIVSTRTSPDYIMAYNEQTTALPTSVRNIYGFRNYEGGHGYGNIASLAGLNDEGKSFEYIADVIEAEPTGLVAE